MATEREYKVIVHTGNVVGAGTDAKVHIKLLGETGDSGELPLVHKKNSFEQNGVDEFIVRSRNIGVLLGVWIGHDNSGSYPGWYLDKIVVEDLTLKQVQEFPCRRWLAKEGNDDQTHQGLGVVKYKVTVHTGSEMFAGTDAKVHITLLGVRGDSGEIKLTSNKTNIFERSGVDEFIVKSPYLGSLHSLRVGHDNSGTAPAWFLDNIVVEDLLDGRAYEFPCKRWLAKDADDGQICRELVRV